MSDWNIKSGSRVLVHAGSSGVGTWVVQIAKVCMLFPCFTFITHAASMFISLLQHGGSSVYAASAHTQNAASCSKAVHLDIAAYWQHVASDGLAQCLRLCIYAYAVPFMP